MGLCDLKAVNGIYYFLVYFKGLIVRDWYFNVDLQELSPNQLQEGMVCYLD